MYLWLISINWAKRRNWTTWLRWVYDWKICSCRPLSQLPMSVGGFSTMDSALRGNYFESTLMIIPIMIQSWTANFSLILLSFLVVNIWTRKPLVCTSIDLFIDYIHIHIPNFPHYRPHLNTFNLLKKWHSLEHTRSCFILCCSGKTNSVHFFLMLAYLGELNKINFPLHPKIDFLGAVLVQR